jgi:lysophospholipase L1-like esterase
VKAPKPRSVRLFGAMLLLGLAGAAALEATIAALLARPASVREMPGVMRTIMRRVYWNAEGPAIQVDPACARYDEELTYTLRPGVCSFDGREFQTKVRANRLGLRDDDGSLEAPEVIILGDSFAMGWGVEHSETFAALLEQRSGRVVLNAAISSYGTAREVLLLKRLDTTRLRLLIVQYCSNDYAENHAFLQGRGTLAIRSREKYLEHQRKYAERHYFPGQLIVSAFRDVELPRVAESLEAEAFLDTLAFVTKVELTRTPIVVLPMDIYGRVDGRFAAAVRKLAGEREKPARLTVIDLGTELRDQGWFALDGHLDVRGHRIVADALAAVLARQLEADTVD